VENKKKIPKHIIKTHRYTAEIIFHERKIIPKGQPERNKYFQEHQEQIPSPFSAFLLFVTYLQHCTNIW